MSYFDYPRLHFSGRFKASPSTINNTPNNFDPKRYPHPNELDRVELFWNPLGDGGFGFVECVVTRVDYEEGSSSTTPEQDPIIGQPVTSINEYSRLPDAALVDLDPAQQNVSEIWAMNIQIGGAENCIIGSFRAVSFNAIWGQAQGENAPKSSASGSGVYQSTLKNLQRIGGSGHSKFLQSLENRETSSLSMNFNLNTHNNSPPIWRFNRDTFARMRSSGVPSEVLDKILPMQNLTQNRRENGEPTPTTPLGDVPAQDFVVFLLKKYLLPAEYNAHIDTIMNVTATDYRGSTSEPFLFGLTAGTIGVATADEPTFFVPSRMMSPATGIKSAWFAPFVCRYSPSTRKSTIQINLGNSLPTDLPGTTPDQTKLGGLSLVSFPPNEIGTPRNMSPQIRIPYNAPGFITHQAGMFTAELKGDFSTTPLGISSSLAGQNVPVVILAESPGGWYLRADQFVYRMNPGMESTVDFPRGKTASVKIHARSFGAPVPDGTPIYVKMMTQAEAEKYTKDTIGTGGINGIKDLSIPQDALLIDSQATTATQRTRDGVAEFTLTCTNPGNPRAYYNGQIYFLNYGFANQTVYNQNRDDIISVLVYNQEPDDKTAPEILAKFGMLYKIMDFLADQNKTGQIDWRNLIKELLQTPFSEIRHMPLTRDISEADRRKIVKWIDALNQS